MPDSRNRRVKLTDIAEKTGYTVGTISKALQNREGISRETRENILKAAKEIGYIANAQAGALRSGSSKTVAVIVSDIANPFFAIEVKACVAELEKYGYRAIVMDTEESPEREAEAVVSALSKNVDGVLLCPTQKSTESINLLKNNGMPFVLMGRRFENCADEYVVCDDETGGYLAGAHLAELGHRRILVVTAEPNISSSRERLSGFMRAMSENGVEVDPALILEAKASAQDTGRMVTDAIDRGTNFTAIFSFSDYIAWEVIYALNERGIHIPEDISIVGFDDIQSHMRFPPPLTTIHFPKRLISRTSVETLLALIRDPGRKALHCILPVYLVQRGSTKPLDSEG